MPEAYFRKNPDTRTITATAAYAVGQVLQLADGAAGHVIGAGKAIVSGDKCEVQVRGVATIEKTASIVILNGQEVWWDESANKAIHSRVGGDFVIGCAVKASAASETTVDVELNAVLKPRIALGKGRWDQIETLGLGIEELSGHVTMEFDAVAEAATAALTSRDSVGVALNPILEAVLSVEDNGDDAALDINIGFANAAHATDMDSATESALVHIDGNVLNILAESDDGTTEVAATDTTVDYVVGTEFFVQIDASDPADVLFFINGVAVLTGETFVLTDATGPLKACCHMEKSSNDTTGKLELTQMHVRTSENV